MAGLSLVLADTVTVRARGHRAMHRQTHRRQMTEAMENLQAVHRAHEKEMARLQEAASAQSEGHHMYTVAVVSTWGGGFVQ